jgi:hypothetical protein
MKNRRNAGYRAKHPDKDVLLGKESITTGFDGDEVRGHWRTVTMFINNEILRKENLAE